MAVRREYSALVVFTTLIFTGCSVGEVALNNTTVDAPPGVKLDSAGVECVDRGPVNAAHVHDGGGTNAGTDCMVNGCHQTGATGAGAPAFTAAGTVYEVDKTTANGGVNIRIFAKDTTTPIKAVSDDAGNFYFTQPIQFPATTNVTTCPDAVPMLGTLGTQADGACSRAGCHVTAGQGAVYLVKK